MKKYLYITVLATMILISTTVVNASNEVYYTNKENVEMTEKEYNNLLGLGFTEKQISRMDNETFLDNKDLEGTVLRDEGKYYKKTTIMRNGIKKYRIEEITSEEALEEVKLQEQNPSKGPAGNYYDGVFATSIIYVKNKIIGISNTYMRLKTDVEWLTIPSERYNDIIGIGIIPSEVQIYLSTVVFREDWLTTDGNFGYTTVCSPKSESTGGSAIFALPSGSLSQLEAYIYFHVVKQNGVGTLYNLHSAGSYAHAYTNVSQSNLYNHFTTDYVTGIWVDSTYGSYYSATSPAYAAFVGTW